MDLIHPVEVSAPAAARSRKSSQADHRRLVPLTTMSTCRLPRREQTSGSRQSRTEVPSRCRLSVLGGAGCDLMPSIPDTTRLSAGLRMAGQQITSERADQTSLRSQRAVFDARAKAGSSEKWPRLSRGRHCGQRGKTRRTANAIKQGKAKFCLDLNQLF
jgi:hypothetical protein